MPTKTKSDVRSEALADLQQLNQRWASVIERWRTTNAALVTHRARFVRLARLVYARYNTNKTSTPLGVPGEVPEDESSLSHYYARTKIACTENSSSEALEHFARVHRAWQRYDSAAWIIAAPEKFSFDRGATNFGESLRAARREFVKWKKQWREPLRAINLDPRLLDGRIGAEVYVYRAESAESAGSTENRDRSDEGWTDAEVSAGVAEIIGKHGVNTEGKEAIDWKESESARELRKSAARGVAPAPRVLKTKPDADGGYDYDVISSPGARRAPNRKRNLIEEPLAAASTDDGKMPLKEITRLHPKEMRSIGEALLPNQRHVFMCYYLRGMTMEEVAEQETGSTKSSISKTIADIDRLFHARGLPLPQHRRPKTTVVRQVEADA